MGLSDDVPLQIIDADGAVLAVWYTVALELATHTVSFGPTDLDVVSFVSEESDHL